MRALFVDPMHYGANAGVDAIAQGLRHRLAADGIELRVLWADFREDDWHGRTAAAVRAGVEAGVDAIVVYALAPDVAAEAVEDARERGIPVFSFARPHYRVNGSVIYPNFNHGILITEYLAGLLPEGAEIAVVGGPEVVDDIELDIGLLHGAKVAGLNVVNDTHDPRYRNVSDVSEMGREVTGNILDDFPGIAGLIPYNDETMHGSVEALRERGRLGELMMVSRNGTERGVEAVRQGWHHGTLDIDCLGIGAAVGALVARQLVGGEQLDDEIAVSPIGRMVGAAEAAAWVPPPERIPYEPLHEGVD
jgi:ABC-type sugar transport system substrate-binding protein